MRPAHIHFIVSAEGYEPLTTHVFADGDEYLNSDAVFATKISLIGNFKKSEDAELATTFNLPSYFCHLEFDIGLMPTS